MLAYQRAGELLLSFPRNRVVGDAGVAFALRVCEFVGALDTGVGVARITICWPLGKKYSSETRL